MNSGRPLLLFSVFLAIAAAASMLSWHHWTALTTPPHTGVRDLLYIVQQIKRNHPGMYDIDNPHFGTHLKEHAQHSIEALSKATSPDNKKEIISAFTHSFDDNHLCVIWHNSAQPAIKENSAPFATTQPYSNMFWITIPTFYNLTRSQKDQLKGVLTRLPSLRNAQNIVFDLRGNGGGDTQYADAIVEALFGAAYAQHKKQLMDSQQQCFWRATPDIQRHAEWIYQETNNTEFKEVAHGIAESIATHQPLYKQASLYKKAETPLSSAAANPVATHITCIIDQSNGSAALDFIDYLKALDHPVTLVGQTTRADRIYMELRLVPLPSGAGSFGHPVKMYYNRARGDNQPYQPDIKFDGNMSNTEALQALVTKQVRTTYSAAAAQSAD